MQAITGCVLTQRVVDCGLWEMDGGWGEPDNECTGYVLMYDNLIV